MYKILNKILNLTARSKDKVKRVIRQNVWLTRREKAEGVRSELKTSESSEYGSVNICEA